MGFRQGNDSESFLLCSSKSSKWSEVDFPLDFPWSFALHQFRHPLFLVSFTPAVVFLAPLQVEVPEGVPATPEVQDLPKALDLTWATWLGWHATDIKWFITPMSLWFMVPITIVNGVYKPSYNWGGPHCSFWRMFCSLADDSDECGQIGKLFDIGLVPMQCPNVKKSTWIWVRWNANSCSWDKTAKKTMQDRFFCLPYRSMKMEWSGFSPAPGFSIVFCSSSTQAPFVSCLIYSCSSCESQCWQQSWRWIVWNIWVQPSLQYAYLWHPVTMVATNLCGKLCRGAWLDQFAKISGLQAPFEVNCVCVPYCRSMYTCHTKKKQLTSECFIQEIPMFQWQYTGAFLSSQDRSWRKFSLLAPSLPARIIPRQVVNKEKTRVVDRQSRSKTI